MAAIFGHLERFVSLFGQILLGEVVDTHSDSVERSGDFMVDEPQELRDHGVKIL